MSFIKQTSPHIHRKDSLARMLIDVLIALAPVSICAFIVYPLASLRNFLIPMAVMLASEFVFVLILNRIPYDGTKHTFKEHWQKGISAYRLHHVLAPLVSAVIFGLIMPTNSKPGYVIYLALVFGSLFGIVIGKLVFGGTGQNIFNPALVGMVFAKLCFGSKYIYETNGYVNAVNTGGTVLTDLNAQEGLLTRFASIQDTSLLDLFLGRVPGVLGETFKFAILIGLVYLLIRHAADIRVIASYLLTFILLMAVAGIFVIVKVPEVNYLKFLGFQVLSGGLLFGATFMITDPVTMPINAPGRILYGIIAGGITVIIRLFGAYPEGVAFSILLANLAAPAIDHYVYSSNKWSKKKVIIASSFFAFFIAAVCLGLGLGGMQ